MMLAPFKCVFLPLMRKDELVSKVLTLEKDFRQNGIMCRNDCGSTAIGKRYARTDEMGIPFAITVDYETLDKDTVTIRDIDSMRQVRVPVKELRELVMSIIEKGSSFEELTKNYPLVQN